ncbi:molybdenum cofactor guanylyltransferase [Blastococcus sp. TF02A-30]|uniref:molybdenum cofactor guanylyltransferase n=1 Tax=Blastococcus sp. TF02A-30 TaxID=2250580 RepID=UPI000DE9C400|nr:NTP transferase domain-containing protein [Blastococcus sp. TF02A-30]RBY93152.1 molybdenum cofactor guanylyltransferase [Blastococcus sp. TF02A-30]
MEPLPPWTALVLAGGRGERMGGQAKPQLEVGGRTMLATVLAAVADAAARVVVGPPQPVPDGVVVLREEPPGGGPVAALRAGLPEVGTEVVVLLAADLPFLTADLVTGLRSRLEAAQLVEVGHERGGGARVLDLDRHVAADADGVVVVDETGRDQHLLGAWRTAALRAALPGDGGPSSLRRVLAPLSVRRWRPDVAPGSPPPWADCDTPADLARARAVAGRLGG